MWGVGRPIALTGSPTDAGKRRTLSLKESGNDSITGTLLLEIIYVSLT